MIKYEASVSSIFEEAANEMKQPLPGGRPSTTRLALEEDCGMIESLYVETFTPIIPTYLCTNLIKSYAAAFLTTTEMYLSTSFPDSTVLEDGSGFYMFGQGKAKLSLDSKGGLSVDFNMLRTPRWLTVQMVDRP